jgi:hypothetical protein
MPVLKVRPLHHRQHIKKLRSLQRSSHSSVARWVTILLLSREGRTVQAIAAGMGLHVQTVRERIRTFNRADHKTCWDLFRPPARSGRPLLYGPAVQQGIVNNRGRGECRVPVAPAASRAKKTKHTSVVTARFTGETRHSRTRMVLTVSFALSSVTGLSCHRRLAKIASAKLDTSVGASGPHDFAVRACAARLRRRRVHRIPHPTSVTIAQTPLM